MGVARSPAVPRRAAGKSAAQDPLAKLGIARPFDGALHLPLRYEDETRVHSIREAPRGRPVAVEGEIVAAEVSPRPRRALLCRLRDASGQLLVRFFHFYASQTAALAVGNRVRLFGEIRDGFFPEMVHPRYRLVKGPLPLPTTLTPVYPATAGVSQNALRKRIRDALRDADLTETLPEAVLRALGLPGFEESIRYLHAPPADAPLAALEARNHPAWRRIKFDELLAQQLSLRRARRNKSKERAPALPPPAALLGAFVEGLPFSLTPPQRRAMETISRDLAQPAPMHRLLQGDVGSGKTVVSAAAALQAIGNGFQVAVMAPTDILAEQHFRKFSAWLAPLGIPVAWLSGGGKAQAQRETLQQIGDGTLPLAVGTHALFQERVRFAKLGLAIIDEQHRFGVRQRLALREKADAAEGQPHQLMMSATPIPRTLAMSYYADLDVSVIDALPPGRTPVATKLISATRRPEVVHRVKDLCLAGHQAYWVCPLVEESEALQLKAALQTHAELTASLPQLTVGLIHGRLPAEEKAAVMARFQVGEIDLLVATTVIEVGVDAPNATLMVIEHAERLGLSQLHQLRGRVGRGAASSTCLLLYETPLGETARQRLKIIFEHADGFEIARHDLRLRGPGELLGARQSGQPLLRFADIAADVELLESARDLAETLLDAYPEAAQRHLARWLADWQEVLKA